MIKSRTVPSRLPISHTEEARANRSKTTNAEYAFSQASIPHGIAVSYGGHEVTGVSVYTYSPDVLKYLWDSDVGGVSGVLPRVRGHSPTTTHGYAG